MARNEERAEAARTMAREIGDVLYEKQLAYGDSGAIALPVWQARLAQYMLERDSPNWNFQDVLRIMDAHPQEQVFYILPGSLIAHIPRLTRVDDRINRLVSNPAGDRMGEDPWRDMAGDAVIGAIMPRAQLAPGPGAPEPATCGHVHPVHGPCEREPGHVEAGHPEHRRVHAGGVMRWFNEHDNITRQHAPASGYTHGYEVDEEEAGAAAQE